MYKIHRKFIIITISLIFLTSCKEINQKDTDILNAELNNLKNQYDLLSSQLEKQTDELDIISSEYAELKLNFDLLQGEYDGLLKENYTLEDSIKTFDSTLYVLDIINKQQTNDIVELIKAINNSISGYDSLIESTTKINSKDKETIYYSIFEYISDSAYQDYAHISDEFSSEPFIAIISISEINDDLNLSVDEISFKVEYYLLSIMTNLTTGSINYHGPSDGQNTKKFTLDFSADWKVSSVSSIH